MLTHRPFAHQFALFGNTEYTRFMRGTSRFDCQAVDVPACNLYANVGNWTHFALSWTNHGDEDGNLGAEANLYINGETVSLLTRVRACLSSIHVFASSANAHTVPLYARRCTTTHSPQVMTPPTR